MKRSVLVITNIAPLYRSSLWHKLLRNQNYQFEFFYGKDKISGIKEIDFKNQQFVDFQNQLHLVKNRYFLGKLLFWQTGIIRECLSSNPLAAIITGDFHVLTNWIAAIIFRIKGVRVVFWSHGFYGKEGKIKKIIRSTFFKLANQHLLYERRGKDLMTLSGFNEKKMHVVFNSLDYKQSLDLRKLTEGLDKKQVYPFFNNPNWPTLIFVGRLTEVKKLDLLIRAVKDMELNNYDVNLLLVGEGNQKPLLLKLATELEIKEKCHFYGASYSEIELSKLIATADLCVSPGNVGLTAIHCLSYGTPVITHSNLLNQMPEVEVISEGINGLYFEEDNFKSLVDKIMLWLLQNNGRRLELRMDCYKMIDKYYNPNYQVKVIENLLNNQHPLLIETAT